MSQNHDKKGVDNDDDDDDEKEDDFIVNDDDMISLHMIPKTLVNHQHSLDFPYESGHRPQ